MNKRLFLKLGVLLLALSLVSCGKENNSSGEEGEKTTSPSIENAVESKQEDDDVPKNTQQDTQEDETKNGVFVVAGGTNKVQDICEYYLDGLEVTPRIEPSIITGTYSDYNVKTEGNIYIDVILGVKNLMNEAKMSDDIITAKIKINSNEYTCFSVVESADGSDLENYASIKPLETRKIHYVAEVPITEATGEIEIILTINGKDFSNKFNLEGMMP